jgi:hypothetical protein
MALEPGGPKVGGVHLVVHRNQMGDPLKRCFDSWFYPLESLFDITIPPVRIHDAAL